MRFPDLEAVTREGENTWAADASVREEFSGNKEHYLAFLRADAKGLIRVAPRTANTKFTPAQTSAPTVPEQSATDGNSAARIWMNEGRDMAAVEAHLASVRRRHLSNLQHTDSMAINQAHALHHAGSAEYQ